ncbi:hypothetical protein IFM89_023911 [Coptis chinensis]|uniref:F-box associated beta-propeller type 1 domain-containing protein n=1 Tax=Coptis chinensis TaxID=261450 RepID=A0A835I136_9MAGN|nr:hypothetical protein IFM89_023911 [Coptis chinensis]
MKNIITRCLPWVRSRRGQVSENDSDNGEPLHYDIIIAEIFSRLPAECILRLIRPTPYIVDMHLHRATPVIAFHRITMFLLEETKYKIKFTMNFTVESRITKIVSKSMNMELSFSDQVKFGVPRVHISCNGFLLIKKSYVDPNIFLWNPVTGQEYTIQVEPRRPSSTYYSACGFFFHSKAREYRIIFIYGEGGFFKSSVLSLATKLLRLIPGFVSHPPNVNRAPIIFNGALHWMIDDQEYKRLFGVLPHCSNSIVIFNMDQEKFSTMPHPGSQCASERRHYCMGLLEMEGHLCFSDNSSSEVLLDIWILEDSIKQVWAKRHVVHIAPIKSLYKVISGTRLTTTIWKEAEVEAIHAYGDNLLLRVYYKNLFLYNLRLGTFVKVGRQSVRSRTRLGAVAHINSLVSLNIDGSITISH